VAPPWFEFLDYPGARQMKVLREVFESVAWWKLRPDRTLLAEDPEDPDFRTHIMPARAEDGTFALLYLPANPAVKPTLARLKGKPQATWIDPRTGDRRPAALAAEMKTPGEGDWLLLLRTAPRPGGTRSRLGFGVPEP
jgi:hypothetical protein